MLFRPSFAGEQLEVAVLAGISVLVSAGHRWDLVLPQLHSKVRFSQPLQSAGFTQLGCEAYFVELSDRGDCACGFVSLNSHHSVYLQDLPEGLALHVLSL